MTRKEVVQILKVLNNIKEPDGHVQHALAICNKQLAIFNKMKGQLKDQYDYDYERWSL